MYAGARGSVDSEWGGYRVRITQFFRRYELPGADSVEYEMSTKQGSPYLQ